VRQAAVVVSEPARAAAVVVPEPARRPATIVPEPAAAVAAAKKPAPRTPPRGKAAARRANRRSKFRETMWFKKGELDEAVASGAVGEDAPIKADALPIEDRYKDDGSLSSEDEGRLGLHTGATQSMPSIPAAR